MKRCYRCNTPLAKGARFCSNCGAPQQEAEKASSREKALIDLEGDIEQQLTEQFFQALKERVQQEMQQENYQDYSERVYTSGFRDMLARKTKQLNEQINRLISADDDRVPEVNRLLDRTYENMLDYFLIHYGQDLNKVELPEAILKYQNLGLEKIDLYQMVMDYLQIKQERERFYTDFLSMPVQKLRNASKYFLFPARDEKILLLCDTSFFGSGKEGFALTEQAIYWKSRTIKPQTVDYERLQDIERVEEWITINGHFFNVNPRFNLKMLKLLRKLKTLFAQD